MTPKQEKEMGMFVSRNTAKWCSGHVEEENVVALQGIEREAACPCRFRPSRGIH